MTFKSGFLPLCLLPATAFAQVAPAPDAASSPDSTAIVVTATRAPISIDKIDSSITVLDKAAIDRSQDIDVLSLLARTPGVSFSRNGGYGTDATFRIRGAEGDQTVLVVDGVKMTDPASPDGSYNFGNLLIDDASRIEVLRGPQSTLWGSQAIGGVVNIVTPLATNPLEGSFDIEGGSRKTVDSRAAVGGKDGPVTWRLAGERFTTDGISTFDSRMGGREPDGYTNTAVQGRALIDIAPGVSADLRGYYSKSRTDLDGFDDVTFARADTPEYETNRQWFGYGGLNVDLFDGRLRNRVGYSLSETRRYNYDPRDQPFEDRTFVGIGRDQRIEYQGTLAIVKGWDAVFGVEHDRARFDSSAPAFGQTDPDQGRATQLDEYAQVNGEVISGLTLTGGLRHTHYSTYGGRFLFSGGAAWKLPTHTILRANYGEGFKAPSLYQLFSQYGNQALRPTESKGWEAGVTQQFWDDKIALGATYFERRTNNLVVFNSCFGTPAGVDPLCDSHSISQGYYRNVNRSKAQGVEVVGSVHPVQGLSIDGNYSWTKAIDRTPGSTFDNWLPRRPRQEANGSVSYQWPFGLVTGVAVRHDGHSFDDAENTQRLDGYTLVDLRIEMPLAKRFTLFARAENVGNVHYETSYTYGSLGRSIYAGVRARM
jgi:vitamin B12 transporter